MYVFTFFFFFKQKTAYEMRISDWSSDVCSSDLPAEKIIDSALLSGPFGSALDGEEQLITLENEVLKLTLSTRGGRIASVELKNEKRWNGDPLVLFKGAGNSFGLNLFVNHRNYSTNDLYFVPQPGTGEQSGAAGKAVMRLNYGPDQYIECFYSLQPNKYLVDLDIRIQGMQQAISPDVSQDRKSTRLKSSH